MRNFTGETPEIEAVLGLMMERLDRGVSFERFQDRLKNYTLKNMKRAEDIVELIMELSDPFASFKAKNCFLDPSPEEEQSASKMKLRELKVKRFANKAYNRRCQSQSKP